MTRLATVLLLTSSLLGGGAARASTPADDLPVLGDTSSGIVSPEVEDRLGQDFLRQVRAGLPTTSDPLMVYWTELLLSRLAVASELAQPDLSMVLIDSPAINAFAAPGGIVGINLGTFAEAPTVHEFSGILAHELAHLSQRHFARGIEEQRKATLPYLAAMLASAALMATVGGDIGMATLAGSQALAQQNQLRYSRSREREADRLGIDTLARAGMDPYAMSSMFARMQDVYRFERRPPEFLLTHPVTESRVADGREQAAGYPRKAYEDSLEFQLMRSRVRLHLAESPQAAAKMFRAQLEEGRTRNPAAERYGLVLALMDMGRVDEAEQVLAPLLGPGQSLAYTLAEVDIALARDEPAAAIARLEKELRFSPSNLPLATAYARALNRADRHQDAQKVLERLAGIRPQDAQVWYDLAETAGLAGDIVAVHRARAEYFQLHGNLQNALQHLRYALQLVQNDYPMTARLNQRVQDIREMRQRANS
ncbi:MAG TPA: M48 family metalloprotease [Pseudomonadales bacterium]|nr:M48 family metalloprotease [Pseudomonadales bacterium]